MGTALSCRHEAISSARGRDGSRNHHGGYEFGGRGSGSRADPGPFDHTCDAVTVLPKPKLAALEGALNDRPPAVLGKAGGCYRKKRAAR